MMTTIVKFLQKAVSDFLHFGNKFAKKEAKTENERDYIQEDSSAKLEDFDERERNWK